MPEQIDRQEIVNQLTAIGLILFEMIEGIEDRFPTVAYKLTEGAEYTINLIQEIVIEEYIETGTILSTPRLQVDASYHEEQELEDVYKIVEYLDAIKSKLEGGNNLLCASAREQIYSAAIELVQTVRPRYQEEGETKNTWEYLNSTLG